MPTTQPTELPITQIIEEEIQIYYTPKERYVLAMKQLLKRVRQFEQSQIKKAKEDEMNRIVVLLLIMIDKTRYNTDKMLLKEAIRFITNPQ